MGIFARRVRRAATVVIVNLVLCCQTTQDSRPSPVEKSTASKPVAIGEMIRIPAGTTIIGSLDGHADEAPPFEATLAAFDLDKHPVTVAQFRDFIDSTGYLTEAEQFGNGGVLDLASGNWGLVDEANWRFPLGPDHPPAEEDHPVTQVSWNDAVRYAAWAGKRLPTEAEWEYAARGAGLNSGRYPWGDSLTGPGGWAANVWQGLFPLLNRNEDGFLYTSPVGHFGETVLGLTDMGGNVWEWCQDWYGPYNLPGQGRPATPETEKVQRGGSFLCAESWCTGYRVSARSHSTPETALFHVGFRCARDISTQPTGTATR